jgi:citrate lyase beta subunit
MRKVRKTFFTFVVYHDHDDQPKDLRHALQESYDGMMLGKVTNRHTEDVDPLSLDAELSAVTPTN